MTKKVAFNFYADRLISQYIRFRTTVLTSYFMIVGWKKLWDKESIFCWRLRIRLFPFQTIVFLSGYIHSGQRLNFALLSCLSIQVVLNQGAAAHLGALKSSWGVAEFKAWCLYSSKMELGVLIYYQVRSHE